MNFYLVSQDACGAWGQQLTLDLEHTGARTYEPSAYLPGTTFDNAMLLLKFYQYTGDKRFLNGVPKAISWLEETVLPAEKTAGGKYSHATFVEKGTNKPLYVHRKGSNVKYGRYYVDYNDDKLLGHYGGKGKVWTEQLKQRYNKLLLQPTAEVTMDSPLKAESFKGDGTPQQFYDLNRDAFRGKATEDQVKRIINSLDKENRWLVKHAKISNPYIGDGKKQEPVDDYASTNVGDETDTSPFEDHSDQEYISTDEYIKNMNLLISYIRTVKKAEVIK
jgi:hypothetical protein